VEDALPCDKLGVACSCRPLVSSLLSFGADRIAGGAQAAQLDAFEVASACPPADGLLLAASLAVLFAQCS
jgi:hypothetical protein